MFIGCATFQAALRFCGLLSGNAVGSLLGGLAAAPESRDGRSVAKRRHLRKSQISYGQTRRPIDVYRCVAQASTAMEKVRSRAFGRACLDGVDGREGMVVVDATNLLEKIDKAIQRPGRLGKHIKIPLSTRAQRDRTDQVAPAAHQGHANNTIAWRPVRTCQPNQFLGR